MSFGVVAASYLSIVPPAGPMTIVGVAQGSRAGAGSLSVTPPAGAGSYIALFTGYYNHGTPTEPTPPAGWILLQVWEGSWSRHAIYYANTTPGGSWSYGDDFAVQVTGYSAALALPLQYDIGGNGATTYYTVPTTSPSITTTQPALIARFFFAQPFAAAGPYVPEWPAAATVQRNYQVAPDNSTGDGEILAAAYEVQTVAGATGTADWAVNMGEREDSLTVTLAVVPA